MSFFYQIQDYLVYCRTKRLADKTIQSYEQSLTGVKVGKFILKNLDNIPLMSDILKLCHNINPDLIKAIEEQTGTVSKISDAAKNNGILLTKADLEFIDEMADMVRLSGELWKNGLKVYKQFDLRKAYVKPKHLATTGGNEKWKGCRYSR